VLEFQTQNLPSEE